MPLYWSMFDRGRLGYMMVRGCAHDGHWCCISNRLGRIEDSTSRHCDIGTTSIVFLIHLTPQSGIRIPVSRLFRTSLSCFPQFQVGTHVYRQLLETARITPILDLFANISACNNFTTRQRRNYVPYLYPLDGSHWSGDTHRYVLRAVHSSSFCAPEISRKSCL